ncbi:MAG: GlxA family transcriptional regulator [Gammaproteobacteria bacterium]|nr:GlxA family transcriptional regulator [Gammaproteobacteria bacterium]
MSNTLKHVGVIAFDGVNALDLVGPLEVFANAGRADFTRRESRGVYALHVIGLDTRPIVAESGVRFMPDVQLAEAPSLDTIIVPGGSGLREPSTNSAVSTWLRLRAPTTRRVATVCTGVYGLAPTGLLDGRRVTTHWRFAEDAARRFPKLIVDGNALFLKDGRYYTSGGITAGIDLALALVEEDLGPHAALAVAREMIVYLKRPGGQEQYSEPLRHQVHGADAFAELIAWIRGHLASDTSVPALAARVRLSPRQFARRFVAVFGRTPAAYVEDLRLSVAREHLAGATRSIETVAASVGFTNADVFSRRFKRRFGISPRSYRERFPLPRQVHKGSFRIAEAMP